MFTARTRRRTALVAAFALGALSLAACGEGDSGSGKELKLWHYEGADSAMGKAWNQAIKDFEKAHPGVKVKFEEKGFEQIQKTASMVLNSDDAPDIMEYNKGNSTAGMLSKQGLLTDLSDQVTSRGWYKLISDNVKTTCVYQNGLMGSGKWYGVPNYAEYTMVFYNKDMFAKNGVKVPTTFAEFTDALAKFKSKGITPLANAGSEYLGQQYFYQLALSKADRNWVENYERYTGKVDFHDAAWTYAANTLADWVKNGYIDKTSVSTKAEDAGVAWLQGKYPMMFSGSWWFGRFQSDAKFDWDTFLWPGSDMTLGSGGNIWVVPQGSKNKELAYDFIDITLKKANQDLLGNSGGIPVAGDPTAIKDTKTKAMIENFNTLAKNDGLAFYPDWPVASFYTTLVTETQKLINGSASPDAVLDNLQKAYDAGIPKQ